MCNCVARFLSWLCTSPPQCPDIESLSHRCARYRNWNLFLNHFDFALSEVLPRLASLPPSLCSLPLWSFIFSSSARHARVLSVSLSRERKPFLPSPSLRSVPIFAACLTARRCPSVPSVRSLATYFVRAANVALKSSLRRRGGTNDDVLSFVRPSGDLFLNHLHR